MRLRALGRWLLNHESRLFAGVLAALSADTWRSFVAQVGEAQLYIAGGIYDTPLLSLLVMGLSALYMTVIVVILWTARPPQARYETLMPNLLAALAGFGIYGFAAMRSAPQSLVPVPVALALLAAGVALVLWALRYLGRAFSVVPQARRVVRRGPYAYVRHPMYLGNIVTLAGLGLINGTAQAVVLAGLMMLLQVWRSRFEDRLLAATFPAYGDYMTQVRAFVPRWVPRGSGLRLLIAALCLPGLLMPAPTGWAAGPSPKQIAQTAKCQGWHQKALAGLWFTVEEANEYAATDGDQEGMSSVAECRNFFKLQSDCQDPALRFRVESGDTSTPMPRELVEADIALIRAIQETAGCKAVAGFSLVCDAIRVHVKRGQAMTPKLTTMFRECADRRIADRTAGLIRGAM